jgi:hypothetical protein
MDENLPIFLVYHQHIDFHITYISVSYLVQSMVLHFRLLMKATSSGIRIHDNGFRKFPVLRGKYLTLVCLFVCLFSLRYNPLWL